MITSAIIVMDIVPQKGLSGQFTRDFFNRNYTAKENRQPISRLFDEISVFTFFELCSEIFEKACLREDHADIDDEEDEADGPLEHRQQ